MKVSPSFKHLRLGLGGAIIAVGAFIGFGTSSKAEPTGTWTYGKPMPMARTEVAVAASDDKLYVIGGSTADADALTTVEEYDPKTNAWRERAPLPEGLNHMAATVLNGKVYTVGGFTGRAPGDTRSRLHQGASTDAFEYDPASDKWRQLPPLEAPRGSVGVVAIDGKIHAIGGINLQVKTVATHEIYDPTTNTWSEAAPLPTVRSHLAIAAVGGLIHVIGGRYDSRDENSDHHDIYDPKTNAWTSGAPLPTARSGVAYALYRDKILVIGGETSKYANTENEAYDVATETWSTLASVPLGLHASTGATIGEHAYFPGGSTKQGGDAITDQMLVFTLP